MHMAKEQTEKPAKSLETLLKDANKPQAAPVASQIDITDTEALKAMARAKLVAIVQTAPNTMQALPAIRELLDRLEGKPAQSVAVTGHVDHVIQVVRFSDLPVDVTHKPLIEQ